MASPSRTILIIEDDEDVQEILTALLQKGGYRVQAADTGEEGVAACARILPDLVILDIKMPGLSGFDALQRIKSDPKTKEIPVIMCSAFSDVADVEECCKHGACDYITKPFDLDRVLANVSAALAKHPKRPA